METDALRLIMFWAENFKIVNIENNAWYPLFYNLKIISIFNLYPVSEFNKFKLRLKSPENLFQLSAGLNIEKFNTLLCETNYIWAALNLNSASGKFLKFNAESQTVNQKPGNSKFWIPFNERTFLVGI